MEATKSNDNPPPLLESNLNKTCLAEIDEKNIYANLSSTNDTSDVEKIVPLNIPQKQTLAKCQITVLIHFVTSRARVLSFLSLHGRMSFTKFPVCNHGDRRSNKVLSIESNTTSEQGKGRTDKIQCIILLSEN